MSRCLNLPIQHWTVENVYYYVKNLEIDGFKYNENAYSFKKEIINGRLFLNLEKEDLNVLGITSFTKRNALYNHLQKLKAKQIKQVSPIIGVSPNINIPSFVALSPNMTPNMTPLTLPKSLNNTNSPLFGSQFSAISTIQTSPHLLPLITNTPIFNFKPQTMITSVIKEEEKKNDDNNNNNNNDDIDDPEIFNNIQLIKANNNNNNYNLIEIAGIYQGYNSKNEHFILMTQNNIIELNNLYSNNKEMNRNIFNPLQIFKICNKEIIKVQHGWMVDNKLKLPFNPLIRIKINILKNEIINIKPIIIKGHINHINNYNQAWITSDLQIDAIEEVNNNNNNNNALISNIISLKLTNISHKSLQRRDASYLHHDPESNIKLEKGLAVKFSLKLSTRTNPKNNNIRKPVFVQCFGVKLL